MLRLRRDLVTDGRGNPIQGGSLMRFLEVTITAAAFVPVQLPLGHFCKEVKFKTNDNAAFEISDSLSGTNSMTILANALVETKMVNPGMEKETEVMFYVKGTTSTTLELMYLD